MELEPIELSEEDIATVRATRGRCRSSPSRTRPAAERLGVPVETVLERLASLRERGGLRRVAAILYHRRAGFSANGMGVWAVPDERDPRDGQADGGVPRHLALLPAADLPRLAVLRLHDGPRALQGGVRRDPRLDRRGDRDRASARRSTRAPSSRRCGCSTSPTRSRAGKRSTRADHLALRHALRGALPRARCTCCRAGSTRLCARCARSAATRSSSSGPTGAEIFDVDGNTYVDYVCSWGPMILGHAHPAVLEAVTEAARAGHELRRADRRRGRAGRAGRPADAGASTCCG